MDNQDHEKNLRHFAIHQSAAAHNSANSTTIESASNKKQNLNHLVFTLDASPSKSCPMHGENGSFHLPERRQSTRNYSDTLNNRKRDVISPTVRRSYSLDIGSNQHNSNNRQRRSVHMELEQKQKPIPKDKFTGRIDFKSILRRFDPKEEERGISAGNNRNSAKSIGNVTRSRHESEPHEKHYSTGPPPKRGSIVDSDFDFRYPVHHSSKIRFRSGSADIYRESPSNYRPQRNRSVPHSKLLKVDLEAASKISRMVSPTGSNYDGHDEIDPEGAKNHPISPRRVEFGERVVFDFNPMEVGRDGTLSPVPGLHHGTGYFKPILRHTQSDPHSNRDFTIQHANQSHEQQQQNQQKESSVQIFLNDNKDYSEQIGQSESEFDSEGTLEFEERGSDVELDEDDEFERNEKKLLSRSVPPLLSERSQSFPPPKKLVENEELELLDPSMRKTSLPETKDDLKNTFGNRHESKIPLDKHARCVN